MVDVLNHVGLDFAVFGNHEFDVSESAFRSRLAESRFRIIATNVSDMNGRPFGGTVRSAIVPFKIANRDIRVGLIGLTMATTLRPWVWYAPPFDAAQEQLEQLKGKVDAVIALTHLTLDDDQELVTRLPGIDAVLGGHDHENWMLRRGPTSPPSSKRTRTSGPLPWYAHVRPGQRGPSVSARLEIIDQRIPSRCRRSGCRQEMDDARPQRLPCQWIHLERTVAVVGELLDGRESTVRNQPGRLTDLITAGFDRKQEESMWQL